MPIGNDLDLHAIQRDRIGVGGVTRNRNVELIVHAGQHARGAAVTDFSGSDRDLGLPVLEMAVLIMGSVVVLLPLSVPAELQLSAKTVFVSSTNLR